MSDWDDGLRALDAEIARRRAPDYQWFPKPNDNQTPTQRAGNAGARGMQHGELTGLVIARELVRGNRAALARTRAALLSIFDLTADRPDVRDIARSALEEPSCEWPFRQYPR